MYIHKHGNETAQTVIILHPMGITGEKMCVRAMSIAST